VGIKSLLSALLPSWGRRDEDGAVAPVRRPTAEPLSPRLPPAAPGATFSVEIAELEIEDRRRGKIIPLRATFPASAEHSFPVIVFSHGSGGSRSDYPLLIQHWAAHGYVCLQPSHADAPGSVEQSRQQKLRHWASRPRDVSLLLDSFDMIETEVPRLKGCLDVARIGASGHSFGAGTAQLLAGARLRGYPGRHQYSDSRVRAVLLLAPQGSGQLHGAKAWVHVKTPMMIITGTRDPGWGGGHAWRAEPFHGAPAGNKYLILIHGGRHDFGGISRSSTAFPYARDERQAGITQQASLAFWDAHLSGRSEAQEFLKKRGLEELLGEDAQLERK
jgi:predicted dienelactone hydrolase